MALKSVGSSPAFPNIRYNQYAYVINHFNILNPKRMKSIKIIKTTGTMRLVRALHRYGVISNFIVVRSASKLREQIIFTSTQYSCSTYFGSIRLVSSPSKAHTISIKALRLASKSVGTSLIFLETNKGIITHTEALKMNVTGRILCVVL